MRTAFGSQALLNHHPPITEFYALRLTDGAHSVVLSGDTAPFDGWQDFCAGADLLVHEAFLDSALDTLLAGLPTGDDRLRDHITRSHKRAEDVGRLATHARVKCLALNHFVPGGVPGAEPEAWENAVRRTWDGPLLLEQDGLRIPLDDPLAAPVSRA